MSSRRPAGALEPGRGAGFPTLRLVREAEVWVYRPTGWALAFARVFLILGAAAVLGAALWLGMGLLVVLAFLGVGALFVAIGRHLLGLFRGGARFELPARRIEIPARRAFWPVFEAGRSAQQVRFDEVERIEIVEKSLITSEGSDVINHECNLVLKDGRCFNLVSHTDVEGIAQEAALLSGLLGVPVDSSDNTGR